MGIISLALLFSLTYTIGGINMIDTHLNEQHQDLTILARSPKKANGYLHYYWCKCSCGNYKRLRYDQIKKKGNCGLCEDFRLSFRGV